MRSLDLASLPSVLVLALVSGAVSAAPALATRQPLGVALALFAAGVVLGLHTWSEGERERPPR